MGVLGGVGLSSVVGAGRPAVLALCGCGGPWGGPAACVEIVPGVVASALLSIVAAGGPHVVGVLFLFGFLPQVHSQVSGRLAGVFPALTRRG